MAIPKHTQKQKEQELTVPCFKWMIKVQQHKSLVLMNELTETSMK